MRKFTSFKLGGKVRLKVVLLPLLMASSSLFLIAAKLLGYNYGVLLQVELQGVLTNVSQLGNLVLLATMIFGSIVLMVLYKSSAPPKEAGKEEDEVKLTLREFQSTIVEAIQKALEANTNAISNLTSELKAILSESSKKLDTLLADKSRANLEAKTVEGEGKGVDKEQKAAEAKPPSSGRMADEYEELIKLLSELNKLVIEVKNKLI